MDSKHWDWGKGYCRKHLGNGVPCQVCIATADPELERTREEWERDIAAALASEGVRPFGEPIKGSWSPGGTVNPQNIPKTDFRINPTERVQGIFVIGSEMIRSDGYDETLDIEFDSRAGAPIFGKLYSQIGPIHYKKKLPKIDMTTRDPSLVERMKLVADKHRQTFLDAGIEDPDELLRALGAEELIQPKIESFELPKRLPRRVPVDMDLIGTIIEAEGCSEELRAALMSQIAIYGAPTICGLLAAAGVDEEFIDSLTSNR
jgi:hypothetical protein